MWKNSKALTILILSLIISSQVVVAKEPALIRKGYSCINRGYISNAIPVFRKAVKLYPNSVSANLGMALASTKQGGESNFKLAITYYRKVLNLEPTNFVALSNLARLLSWSPSTRVESINLYQRALLIKPYDKNLNLEYSEVLLWSSRYAEAASILDKYVVKDPGNLKLGLNYANALSGSGQYYKCLDYYKKAIDKKLSFDNFTALNYARALVNTNQIGTGLRIFNDVLALSKKPEYKEDIKKELAGILFAQGDYAKAIQYDNSIKNKDKDVLVRLARSNEALNNKEEAIALYEQLCSEYPDDIDIKRSTAHFLTNIGGYNQNAIKLFNEIINSGNAIIDDKINLANLYNLSDNTKVQAISLYREVLNSAQLSGKDKNNVMLSLARSLSSMENTRPDSVEIYRQLLNNNPDDLELNLELYNVLSWQDATRNEAIVKYLYLLDKYPDNQRLLKDFNQALGWYLPGQSDFDLYERILKLYPDNMNALKGFAYLVSKNPETKMQAVDIYKKILYQDPNNLDIQYQLAVLLAANKSTRNEALQMLQKIHNQKPDDLEVTVTLANNLLYQAKYKDSKALFSAILAQSPDNKDALLGQARIYYWQGLDLAAYKAYSTAYEKYPMDEDICYEFATVAKKLGNYAKAMELLEKVRSSNALPEAPEVPMITTALNCQSIKEETSSDSINNANTDISQIQGELESLQKSINELQLDINKIEKRTAANVNNTSKSNTAQDKTVYLNSDSSKNASDLREPTTSNENYKGRVSYITNSETKETPAVMIVNKDDEVNGNPGPSQKAFKATSFDDILSGRGPMLRLDQFNDLRKNVYYDMRPEIRTGFGFSTEAGDPTSDAMKTYGFPTMVSFNLTPQNRIRLGISSTTYGMSHMVHPHSITGTSYVMGINSKPHARLNLDGEVVINSYSDPNAPVEVDGKANAAIKLHDRIKMNVGFRREPLYQSVFETTGYTLQPQYSYAEQLNILSLTSSPLFNPNNSVQYANLLANPNYYNQLRGPFMGQVRDNAVGAEFNFTPFNKWDFNVGYEYSAVEGIGVQHNGRQQTQFSLGRTFTGVKDHIFRLGYQFLFFGYSKDLSAFPNMTSYPYNENGSPIPVVRQMPYNEALSVVSSKMASPQDVLSWANNGFAGPLVVTNYRSPVDLTRAPMGVGIGGYFSPETFFLNSFRLDLEGKLFNGRLAYKGGGSLGVQNIGYRTGRNELLAARGLLGYANIPMSDPRRSNALFNSYASEADSIQDNSHTASLASAFDLTLFLRLTDYLTLFSGVDYLNAGAYNRWRYNGGLIIRPNIKCLSPIFRKVSSK